MPFGALIRGLLQQWATDAVRQSVVKAAVPPSEQTAARDKNGGEQNSADSSAAAESSAPVEEENPLAPCHVGLLFALGTEAGSFEDRLRGMRTITGKGFTARVGQLANRRIAVIRTGSGLAAAEHGAAALLAGHQPSWVISAGFAGGLQPHVARGDLVLANEVISPAGERLMIDVHGSPAAPDGVKTHLGAIVTSERVVPSVATKRTLGEKTGALAVEMETWAIAKLCAAERHRFLSVRIISDPVDEELPADVEKFLEKQSAAKLVGRTIGSLFRRPSVAKDLWKLQETALVCAERMAKFLTTLIRELP